MECAKIYNVRTQISFCLFNLLFDDVMVAFAVMLCLINSLILNERDEHSRFSPDDCSIRKFNALELDKKIQLVHAGHIVLQVVKTILLRTGN